MLDGCSSAHLGSHGPSTDLNQLVRRSHVQERNDLDMSDTKRAKSLWTCFVHVRRTKMKIWAFISPWAPSHRTQKVENNSVKCAGNGVTVWHVNRSNPTVTRGERNRPPMCLTFAFQRSWALMGTEPEHRQT